MFVICGFLIGVFCAQFLRALPSVFTLILLFAVSLLIVIFLRRNKLWRLNRFFSGFMCGFFWLVCYASYYLSWSLPADLVEKNTIVEGFVATIPILQDDYVRFDFKLTKLATKKCHALLRLSGKPATPNFQVGDKWQLLVKLKKPHGLLNPGGFDKEKQLLINHIRAEGRIINNADNSMLQHRLYSYPLQRLRENLQHRITTLFPESPLVGIVLALTIGLTNRITQPQWQIFRNTGTNHLVAISGLHIGLVASIFGLFIKSLWRRCNRLTEIIPAHKVAITSGLTIALLYSALAGFSVSTQRSLVTLVLWGFSHLFNRNVTFNWVFFCSMLLVSLCNPFALFTMSFWLSYLAVGCLLWGMSSRLSADGLWWRWGRPQCIVFLGMLPITLFFFQQISFTSMLANVIAIPWVSFGVVPELLCGLFLSFINLDIARGIFFITQKSLEWLWLFLAALGKYQFPIWHFDLEHIFALLLFSVGTLILLSPRGWPGRWLALTWFSPLLVYHYDSPLANQVQLTVFDVGQGLATLIRTPHHVLIYDTGIRLNDSYDMGKVVLLPNLRFQHINDIDMLVISHGDNDHIGGAFTLLKEMPVKQLVTSVPHRFSRTTQACRQGLNWQWDDVDFRFLHPTEASEKSNNLSCVLQMRFGKNTILLTGDIENKVEAKLAASNGQALRSTILVVPHHGSKSSSSLDFVKLVHPKYAIFSYGYCNRYHHPNLTIWNRYLNQGSINIDTVANGAITMTLTRDSDIVLIDRYRLSHHRFWHY